MQMICAFVAASLYLFGVAGAVRGEWAARIGFAIIAFACGTELGRYLVKWSMI
ncbi:hypothetical protein [Sinorhizobium meliloti]|uniref:hypothetical protein n=1 Tax=Rhizobium meliloti TaxID=382 RepID=UPI0013E337EE|nr:hypothetical protein [Sinorhizobium meliloti]